MQEFYPVVSVIIPQYKRVEWFKIALDSVLNQTYKNIEIFITDNSPDTKTKDMMREYLQKYSNIIYEHQPEYSASDNWNRAIAYNNPKAEYVNWLMNDDVFMPNKIEFMLDKFKKYENLTLVTSYRQCIDENGNVLPDCIDTIPIAKQDVIIKGQYAGNMLLSNMRNYIGEPTTVLVKKSAMRKGTLGGAGTANDDKYIISDFPTWLQCLRKGDLYYAVHPFSQYRRHSNQGQFNIDALLDGIMRWAIELCAAWEEKSFITNENDLKKDFSIWTPNVENYMRICDENKYDNIDKINDLVRYSMKIQKILLQM